MCNRIILLLLVLVGLGILVDGLIAQNIGGVGTEKWVTATAQAAGTTQKSKDEAIAKALRRAVEQGCGVFLKAQSITKNYKGIYDKVFADAVGYVKKHDPPKCWIEDDIYHAKVRALVSTRKFEKDWSSIAHTYHRENNPRVIVVIGETTYEMVNELETEEKHSSARTATVSVEARRRTDATRAAAAARRGDTVVVTGRYSWWSGRPRPRRWTAMSSEQRAAWIERTAVEEEASAKLSAASTAKSRDSHKVWRRVADTMTEGGTVQTRIEDFFLEKGIKLVDRGTAEKVNKRDLMLASAREDQSEVAALGAKFGADVIIIGSAAAKAGGESSQNIAGRDVTQYEYNAKLVVRAIRTDSAQLMVSKVYQSRAKSMRKGGETGVMDKLAKIAAPKLLTAVVEAWRKQVQVTRDIALQVSGMDYKTWKAFETEAGKLRGVKALRLREITESVANINVDYEFSTQNLADNIAELKTIKIEVTEFNPNRLKLKVVKKK